MTTIGSAISLAAQTIKPLDTSKLKALHVSELPDEQFQQLIKAQETFLKLKYTKAPDTSNNPTYKPYAEIIVDGKAVAKIDNHGWTETSNALGARLQNGLPAEADGIISGPKLAQARAEYIAEQLGGEVEIADTALTQLQFNAIPQPELKVDIEALKNDPAYEQLQKTIQARTEFQAQQIAQEGYQAATQTEEFAAPAAQAAAENSQTEESSGAEEEFLELMEKSSDELYYEMILKEKGLTQEELDAMPLEDRLKILEEIKAEIKRRTQEEATKKSGMLFPGRVIEGEAVGMPEVSGDRMLDFNVLNRAQS